MAEDTSTKATSAQTSDCMDKHTEIHRLYPIVEASLYNAVCWTMIQRNPFFQDQFFFFKWLERGLVFSEMLIYKEMYRKAYKEVVLRGGWLLMKVVHENV